jgi:hypothetical protein
MSVPHEIEAALKEVLEDEANQLAHETGCIERERKLTGADLAQTLVFGWLSKADATLDMLTQVAAEREVRISAAGLSKRFTPEAATFFQRVLHRMAQVRMRAEAVPIALLQRFRAVVVEDSSCVVLPSELVEVWRGCGGRGSMSAAAVKLHVRWDLVSGELHGPLLTDGRVPDVRSPFKDTPLPAESLYLADLGYFDLAWLKHSTTQARGEKRRFLMRLKQQTQLFWRTGKRVELRGILPQQVGQTAAHGVQVGAQARLRARLILVRVPQEVAAQRRERLQEEARKDGRVVSEEQWYLAQWIILITNVPAAHLSIAEALVLVRLRWQIELLFKLWKTGGNVDASRSTNPWRILCEFYAKVIAMLIQHWLLILGCWHDPHRSLVKAAVVVRQAAIRLLAALQGEASVTQVVRAIQRAMRSGCRVNMRKKYPTTSQLLLDGLDWPLS